MQSHPCPLFVFERIMESKLHANYTKAQIIGKDILDIISEAIVNFKKVILVAM